MDLLCYVPTGWTFNIRPAEAKRDWMDRTPDAFAYRCLPLNIANAHGWEVLSPASFEAIWNGGSNRADLTVRMIGRHEPAYAPVSLFGSGILTIHMHGLFRTEPGWNLWVSGPPNRPKDGIYPLTGIVETDWSPYTFTMNWQITRPNQWVRFDEGEPVCFFFPVRRGLLDTVEPKLIPFEKNPELLRQFDDWRHSRDHFYKHLPAGGATGDTWQKRYYRGVDMHDKCPIADHETKLRVRPFVPGEPPQPLAGPTPAAAAPPPAQPAAGDPDAIRRALQTIGVELMMGADPAPLTARIVALGAPKDEARRIIETAMTDPVIVNGRAMALSLRRRDWLLERMERQWLLAPSAAHVERRAGIGSDEFLERYYAPRRPAILLGEAANWPALAKWTPDYLRTSVGAKAVKCRVERVPDAGPEAGVDAGERELNFDRVIELAAGAGAPAGARAVAIEAALSPQNRQALAPLLSDLGTLDKFLDRGDDGQLRIGAPARLRHAAENTLIVSLVGRLRFELFSASAALHRALDANGGAPGLDVPGADAAGIPALRDANVCNVTLSPGEMLFLPLGWWHRAQALDFAVSIAYTNFRWPSGDATPYPMP